MLKFKIVAKTFSGLENILFKEIVSLIGGKVEKLNRGILYYGTWEDIYKSNLFLRTALNIMVEITHFDAKNKTQLYNKMKEINWGNYFNVYQTFAIDTIGQSKYFNSKQYIAQVCKDAVADQFREKYDKRPNVFRHNPEIPLVVHMQDEHVAVYFNSSGDSLFKRGYRQQTDEAPLNEVLAAGIILLSEWDGTKPFIDPMCGSATIPIEAAFIAEGLPSNFFRNQYAFMNLKNYDRNLWLKIRDSFCSKSLSGKKIIGSDINENSIEIAKENVRAAKLERHLKLQVQDFFNLKPNFDSGTIIFNPPYNKRLTLEDSQLFYKEIGNNLKRNFVGFDVWIYTSDDSGIKFLGLHPNKKVELNNAAIKAKLYHYSVFEGKKVQNKN